MDELLIGVDLTGGEDPAPFLTAKPKALQVHADFSGASRKGKSRLVASLLLQKISRGEQVILVDPPGTMYNLIRDYVIEMDDPELRKKIWFINLPKATEKLDLYPSFDFMAQYQPPHVIAEMFLDTIHRVFPELDFSPSIDGNVLMGCLLLSFYNLPLTELDNILTDKVYRDRLLAGMPGSQAVAYFKKYFDKHERASATTLTGSTLRRTQRMNFAPELRYSLASSTKYNLASWDEIFTTKTSVIINTNFKIQSTSHFYGSLLLSGIEQAALGRVELPERDQHPITACFDEATRIIGKDENAVNRPLQQAAKSGFSLWLCYQDLSNIPAGVRGALGNCQLRVAFQCSPEDADYFAPIFFQFDPTWVKDSTLGPGMRRHVTYYSGNEQREIHKKSLSTLPKRTAVLRLPEEPQPYVIYTPDIPDLDIDQRQRDEFENYYFSKLFRPRAVIERELEQRRAWALAQAPEPEEPPKKNMATPQKPKEEIPQPPQKPNDTIDNHEPPQDKPAPPPKKDDDEDDESLLSEPARL